MLRGLDFDFYRFPFATMNGRIQHDCELMNTDKEHDCEPMNTNKEQKWGKRIV